MSTLTILPAPTGLTTYFGGKGSEGTAQTIINQIRPHVAYVELYLGSGQVLRHLAENGRSCTIGNDVDPRIVQAWRLANLPGVEVRDVPALELLDELPARFPTGRVVIYVDPPYPFCSRKSKRKRYRYEMQDAEHPLLLARLRALPGNFDVLVSTYPNPIYASQLPDWRLVAFTAQTQLGQATEYLYCNFPEPTALHDVRWVGEGYRERERIKKLAERWKIRFAKMPPHDRQAVFQALLSTGVAPKHLAPPPRPVVSSSTPTSAGDARGHHRSRRGVPAAQLLLF